MWLTKAKLFIWCIWSKIRLMLKLLYLYLDRSKVLKETNIRIYLRIFKISDPPVKL